MDKVNRLKLEFGLRPHAFFVTLTYSDEFLPVFKYSNRAELYKPDLVKFIDSIRQKLPKITIFAVGEYGGKLFGSEKSTRDIHPHYHLAIFCAFEGIHDLIRAVVTDTWYMGHAHILRLSAGLIDYITGYVSKKLTNYRSMSKVVGLNIRPEFTYSSRRPAIGDISDFLVDTAEQHGEITHISLDGKRVVLPKYLKFKVKDKLLRWDLDLKNPQDALVYEKRKQAQKIDTLQKLREKDQKELDEIQARGGHFARNPYEGRRQIKKQIVADFNSKIMLLKHTKGSRVL